MFFGLDVPGDALDKPLGCKQMTCWKPYSRLPVASSSMHSVGLSPPIHPESLFYAEEVQSRRAGTAGASWKRPSVKPVRLAMRAIGSANQ